LRESYISFSPSAGFLEANKNGILESSNFTWTYYALTGEVKSLACPQIQAHSPTRAWIIRKLPCGAEAPFREVMLYEVGSVHTESFCCIA